MASPTHAEVLLQHAPPRCRAALASEPELAALVDGAVARAQAAWPSIDLPAEVFLRHVAERLPATGPASALRSLYAEDLFLACACVHRNPSALREFQKTYLVGVDRALSRMDLGTMAREDVRQSLQIMLLVGEDPEPPRIAKYSGSGDLRGWVRSTAVRLALRKEVKRRTEEPLPEEYGSTSVEAGVADPELAFLKASHGEQFERAFREGLAALSPKDQNLLKQHYHHGLSFDELGALFQVSKATAARWVTAARAQLLESVRLSLFERLRVGPSTLRSLSGVVRSQLSDRLAALFSEKPRK